MKNRFPDYLLPPKQQGKSSQPTFQNLRDQAQDEFASRLRQVEAYVKDHPAAGIGAAFCIGIFLGWFIKRK